MAFWAYDGDNSLEFLADNLLSYLKGRADPPVKMVCCCPESKSPLTIIRTEKEYG